jgi:hypothetical protein
VEAVDTAAFDAMGKGSGATVEDTGDSSGTSSNGCGYCNCTRTSEGEPSDDGNGLTCTTKTVTEFQIFVDGGTTCAQRQDDLNEGVPAGVGYTCSDGGSWEECPDPVQCTTTRTCVTTVTPPGTSTTDTHNGANFLSGNPGTEYIPCDERAGSETTTKTCERTDGWGGSGSGSGYGGPELPEETTTEERCDENWDYYG